ncbi:phosphatidylglycerophosphate synthase, putative [Plasmodium knowlesi strain H]|uniref:CDP-diacylglycerol--glycerol-3-phosphate 3-phosphatidyltransferase n=2 Tax=Plasmodium knowlesi (strain H) TaxID=5851 RepID=B3L191_PLAKH|nr:phosphatidylglycerophosphate synthase, putative [Plasmodium knowlesi strain H]CAA9990178.1 phosphatidylglycerophosphate synthase, putative [Plasmodium knowlesi strain H]SBO27458.1 phosphatidylglycerophosphate synthase, putative [Plasmodium knowlesi strain H]VVS79652.1 phosphatidylglycerophosphate synthase, putative [Plasmodium knowlesi strain H]|eukprot:XP_002258123.1 phosphatidylglycerophosphate synthase (ec 2.7.8.5) [Plasmodium knowlesi strain H]
MTLKFVIREPKARVLFSPTEFFDTLKGMFRSSKKRIVMSCLYIGIGELEKELIVTIRNNKHIKNLRVDILLDKQRGTRPEGKLKESSVSMLSDLFSYGGNINISLFHNPLLGAVLYNIIPYRANEAIGVMHMKVYIGDDRLILSGANISDSYLRNRQDRYILIENKLLADSIHKIVNCIQKMSFSVNLDLSVHWDSDLMNPLVDAHTFREQYYRRIQFMLSQIKEDILRHTQGGVEKQMPNDDLDGYRLPESGPSLSEREDFFSPLFIKSESILTVELALQSGFSSPPIYDESQMLESMLKNVKKYDQSLIISSGYLNFPENFLKLFRNIYDNLCFKEGIIRFITASPAANSFFKSKGISYYIPLGYTVSAHMCVEFITKNIVSVFKNLNRTDPLMKKEKVCTNIYLEYHKPSWTFHSKGMWLIDGSYQTGVVDSNNTSGKEPYVDRNPQMENAPNSVCTNQNYEQSEKKKKNPPFGIASSPHLFNNDQNCLNRSANLDERKKKNVCENILKSEEMDHNHQHGVDNQIDANNATSLIQNLGDLPWGTVIGSSNYGYRATYRDLEMSFIIKTNDENLKRQFQKELNIIYESSNFVHMDELNLRYPRWLRLVFRYLVRWLL